MRYRASQTLVFSHAGAALLACNFLTRNVFECAPDLVAFLGDLSDWAGLDEIAAAMEGMTPAEARETVEQLVGVSAVIEEGSDLAAKEADFLANWKWSLPAAMMHFCVQDPERMSLEESQDRQRGKLETGEAPVLFSRNDPGRAVVTLPDARKGNELIELMARRRTVRAAATPSITLAQLSDCLFAGMGITGETDNGVVRLPLGMTPSGGARNPYEAYVYALNVDGLAPGFYHYSAADHDLAPVGTDLRPRPSQLVGGQDWADEMPCLILLCASLGRTMWKYEDANAYRVVMIEAGHIGQNIMLAATRHGLTACPTAALSHSLIRDCIGMQAVTDAPIYALTLCVPGIEPPMVTRGAIG